MILSNCTRTRTVSQDVYGESIFSLYQMMINQDAVQEISSEATVFFDSFLKNGHAFKAFFRRLFKNVFNEEGVLSGSSIGPSYAAHTMAATLRADTDIYLPDCL